ncbi:MAG TPA: DNA polymerase III subunit alpha [Spirochaetia bacterium]|nr:DNA polymerase III subunit alpha [Spirochaetia bacterium]
MALTPRYYPPEGNYPLTPFVHLHCHSDFSLLDGASSIDALVSRAKELGMSHLALTDHGNMFGALAFFKECRKQGIKPIIGSEFYKAPGSRQDKAGSEKGTRHNHLVLLARNSAGYKNLLELSSRGYTEGFYYKPRIDDELLEKHHEGLIALSACLAGDIPAAILEGRHGDARKRAGYYRELFGPDGFYLELQDHGIPEQRTANTEILRISRETGVPLVATNDIHYTSREDARAHDVLICIGTGKKVSEGKRMKFEHPEFYFKSGDEMAQVFQEVPEAVANTVRIAEACQLDLEPQRPQFPVYEVPQGYTPEAYLTELARTGLAERYSPVPEEASRRLEYELSVITSMGFTGYFLIVWDFIHYAKSNGIAVGPGRGSGAGSLVAYSLRITDIDPLKYGLLFERFLNPERVSMPDFDIDFCHRRRDEVIAYVTRKYGEDKVGQVITFGTLKARAVIRDVARVLDLPYDEADAIAKLIPEGPKTELDQALKDNPRLEEVAKKGAQYKELLEISLKLEGLHRHASTHAAGIVIGREPLTRYVPLYRDPKTGFVSTQYTMDFLEECGLIKMDFLGLKTLTVIEDALKLVARRGVAIDLRSIPEDDPATFKMFCEGKSTGAFQFESSGMQGVLKRARPGRITDLIALNALYRPGPMENIDTFIENKSGRKRIEYPLPALEPVLRETYGVPVYQEQVMQMAQVVAGFSLGQADILRRAMGKKKPEEMLKMKEKFLAGAKAKGHDAKTGERMFELLFAFAGYGFNKSHSAAYAIPAYHTIYLKANYPAEFLAANCTNDMSDTDRLAQLIHEAREMGIAVLPPDVNLSEKEFTVEGGRIVFGLLGIKNVGAGAVDSIIAERQANGKFASFVDFFERIDSHEVNRKVAESLIITGAFDSLGETRATLMHEVQRVMEVAAKNREARRYGQASLFEGPATNTAAAMVLEKQPEWPTAERLQFEKQNLGFFFSGHPLDPYRQLIERTVNIDLSKKEGLSNERSCAIVGILRDVREIRTRNGRAMAFAQLEDRRGSIELIIFSDIYDTRRALIANDKVVGVLGKIDTTRGDPKVKVDDIVEPGALPQRAAQAVHVRLKDEVGSEESLHTMREYLLDRHGACSLFFHLSGNNGTPEVVVQASSQIQVSDSQDVLDHIREFPQVADVWKE